MIFVVASASLVAGCGNDTDSGSSRSSHDGMGMTHSTATTGAEKSGNGGAGGMAGDGSMPGMDADATGMSKSNAHFTLKLLTPKVSTSDATIRFRILSRHGGRLRDYEPEYTKQLHLIAVRRDFTHYQHLHPTLAADGTWEIATSFTAQGPYRLIADFTPSGGDRTVLATDVMVGDQANYLPEPLLPARATAAVDGYTVTLKPSGVRAGSEGSLAFDVRLEGKPVKLQPYLGSIGHAVVIRTDDFAYLHVHPSDRSGSDKRLTFDLTLPSASRYVAYVQFQTDDQVHTAVFLLDARKGAVTE